MSIDHHSRYAPVQTLTFVQPDGTEVLYLAPRILPLPEDLATSGSYVVNGGDRLDTVAARTLGDPELFWRLVDGNRELLPRALVATPGRTLRLTLPAGFPGVPGA
jgi:hypothetical protein